MKSKICLKYSWISLLFLNILVTILGLYLPFNLPCLKLQFRRISIFVLFFIICSTLISLVDLQGFYNTNNVSCEQIYTIFFTGCCCIILASRYRHYYCAKIFYTTLLSISDCGLKDSLIAKTILKQILRKNIKLLLKVVLYFIIMVYSFCIKRKITYNFVNNNLLFTIVVFEMMLLTESLEIIQQISRNLRKDLKRIYKDFYKVPPAELKKTDNGDMILIGWISEAMEFNKKTESVVEMEELLRHYYLLENCVQKFNVIFGGSIFVVFLFALSKFSILLLKMKVMKNNLGEVLNVIFESLYIFVSLDIYNTKFNFLKLFIFCRDV